MTSAAIDPDGLPVKVHVTLTIFDGAIAAFTSASKYAGCPTPTADIPLAPCAPVSEYVLISAGVSWRKTTLPFKAGGAAIMVVALPVANSAIAARREALLSKTWIFIGAGFEFKMSPVRALCRH